MPFTQQDLISLAPRFDFLVGIDSDGCVFDSMGVKQRQFFFPLIIEIWGLEAIAPQVIQVAEFLNLQSQWRGRNRFANLLLTFEMLHQWDAARVDGVPLPPLEPLRAYVNSGDPLGNPTISAWAEREADPEYARLSDWSHRINARIKAELPQIPIFNGVRECLDRIVTRADAIVVSQTPVAAIVHEWEQNEIIDTVRVVAGQELGSKTEHLQLTMQGRYTPEHVLMIGDAPGDREAAEAVGACFYPINAGAEAASWLRLRDEGLDRFFAGAFAGEFQDRINAEFDALLPADPPWLVG